MGTKPSHPRLFVSTVALLIAVLACPALAQDPDTSVEPEGYGLPTGILVTILIILGGVALIALVITVREFGGAHSNLHRMRRNYFETCRQRRE